MQESKSEGQLKKCLWQWLIETACPKHDPNFLDLARFQAEEDFTKIVEDAKKELVLGSFFQWVSPIEAKPAIQYIAIEYDKFLKWFGSE